MTEEVEYLVPPARIDGPVVLAEPDPSWPRRYEEHSARIREALGSHAMLLEHVGSTSVPALPAKPVIDILLVVADSADEAAYVPDLERAGYVLHVREPDWHEHRLLRHDSAGPVNLHVFSPGSTEADRLLAFRDRLRAHPAERDLYAARKSELAARHWAVVQDYADAKTEVVEGILARAAAEG